MARRSPGSEGQSGANPVGAGIDRAVTPTLAELSEHAGIAVFTWDSIADRVYHSASTPEEASPPQGLTLNDVLGMLKVNGETDLTAVFARARDHGETGNVRATAVLPDGREIFVNATYFPLDDTRPVRYVQIVSQDLSRLAHAEQARDESEAHYRNAVALNPEIPWVADATGRLTEVGPRWYEVSGVSKEISYTEGWLLALHPEDRDNVVAEWRHCVREGLPLDVEYRIRTAGGDYIWMRARARPSIGPLGNILRWYGTLEDVHEKHLTDAALKESEEFARSILESGSIATEVIDLDGRLTFMNRPALQMMEVSDFEAIRGTPFLAVWPADVKPVIARMLDAARDGEVTRNTVFGPTAKGNARWWDFTVAPVRDAEGNIARLLAMSHDVTDTHLSQLEAAQFADRLGKVLEGTLDNVISLDRDFRITYMNHRCVQEFPMLSDGLGKDVRGFFDPTEIAQFLEPMLAAMQDRTTTTFERFLPLTAKWYEMQADCRSDAITVFFRDVTARRETQDRVAHLARHDPLTGLANRLRFRERFQEMLGEPGTRHLAVMAIDLDDFKLVNDSLGHPAGDSLLRQVALRLGVCLGGRGVVARLGGDEFALLAPVDSPDAAATIAQACLTSILQPYRLGEDVATVGASIGIAMTPQDGLDPEIVLNNADVALYQVKAMHGGAYRFFEPAMDRAQRERRKLRLDLGLALKREELSVVYQPQVDIRSRRLVGFEALLRWKSPDRGMVSPAEFIPVAEESGLIDGIGAFVLERAMHDARSWPEHLGLAVNLSPMQFRSRHLIPNISEALDRTGFSPRRLEVEITESVLLEQSTTALAMLGELHSMGICVALDDFGTGYSSLSYLRRFPFDKIKIDRSFVSDLPHSTEASAIVKAITGLGRALGARVTAEGVETWEQLQVLEVEGCDDAQGFLFAPPLPALEAARFAATIAVSPKVPPATMFRHPARYG